MLEVVRAGEILSQDFLHRFQVDPLVIAGIRTQEMPGPSISVRPVGTLNPLWWVRVQHRVMVFRATVDPADALSGHAVDGRMFRSETLLAQSLPPGDLSPVATIDRPGYTILDRMSHTHAETASPLDVFLVRLAMGSGVLSNRQSSLVRQPVQ